MNIQTKSEFINQLQKFTKVNSNPNLEDCMNSNIIIEETTESGQGMINIDISSHAQDDKIFFLKITHKPNHVIGSNKHNDGIILHINLTISTIFVYCFELKTTIRLNTLSKASEQLSNAYYFIHYLLIEKCFQVNYSMIIGYKNDQLSRDTGCLKTATQYTSELFDSWEKDKLPIQLPFCNYTSLPFIKIQFDDTLTI